MGWLWVNIFRVIFYYLGLLNIERFKNIDEFYTRKYVKNLVIKRKKKNTQWKK